MTNTPTPVHDRVARAVQRVAAAHAVIHSAIHARTAEQAHRRAVRLESERLNSEMARASHS